MIQLIRNKDIYGIALMLLLIVLIGYQEMVSPAIGIFFLVVLVEAFIFKSLRFKMQKSMLLFAALYLFYLLGLLWSEHTEIGWKLMEYKMSFFIFPALFLFPKKDINSQFILRGIVWGCILLTARFMYVDFSTETDLPYYEIARQQVNLHPTYVAIYFTTAIIFLVESSISGRANFSVWLVVPLVLAFSLMVVAVGSFAGIIFLGFLIAFFCVFLIYKWINKWIAALTVLMVPLFIYFGLANLNAFQYDLEMVNVVKTDILSGKEAFLEKHKMNPSGTVERVMMWLISTEIIQENPMGVGTGDIDFHLLEKCKKYDLQLLYQLNLNPHNQYLQIGIDLGYLGILFLLFLIFFLVRKGIVERDFLLILVALSLAFNALFESVLQRQSGIVFYTLILCLLLVYKEKSQQRSASLLEKAI